MKISRPVLKFLKVYFSNAIKRRRKNYPSKEGYKYFLNIPYMDDNNEYHTYDVYLAKESNRKHCCVIDIHGGAYLFGHHQDNFPYAYVLLEAGYDVVLMDYEPNNGKKDIRDIVIELANNFKHLKDQLDEYDLSKDKFVLSGDSAGGHLCLLFSLFMQEESIDKELELDIPNLHPIATVLACPVYDFANMGKDIMTSKGLEYMVGPKYNDVAHLEKYTPKTYIKYHKIPMFLSTCTNDFIRSESLMLKKDMEDKEGFKFIDIESDKKEVDHVHNIVKIDLEESKTVNDEIIKFVDKLL